MSGLYDRLKSDDSINVHYLGAGFVGYATGDWTASQVLQGINNLLKVPLSGEELTDLNAISLVLDSQTTAIQKVIYALRLDAACLAAQAGQLGEVGWRNMAGIS